MALRNRSEKIDMLRSVPMFAGLSKRHLNEIAKHVDEHHIDAGEVVAREGQTGRELFILVQGTAKVTRKGRKLGTLGPGDFIGEMALLDGEPRIATVVAEEPLVTLVLSSREFKPLLRAVPDIAEGLLRILAGRLRAADKALTH